MAAPTRQKNAAATRALILDAARREFSQVGFGSATVRSIAHAAEVSPNLITRYFGGKNGLFAEAVQVDLHVDEMFDGPLDRLGERMARTIVARWASVANDPLLALMRAAGEHPEAARMLDRILDRESLVPLRRNLERAGLDPSTASSAARAVDTFLYGLTGRLRMLRTGVDDPDELRTFIADTVQRLIPSVPSP
ncbi:TetR/AcrR family transcriptional regulator [Curtobacterium pusillum]|uniref:TetR/AcrR family transcriptional regulator n=1 Tax=Curtobacterium pusillum TaxID=69373 RepID=UPI0011A043C8|nr:TetR/AcrR family transcriptional regulator [Curtobacterium pusillum]